MHVGAAFAPPHHDDTTRSHPHGRVRPPRRIAPHRLGGAHGLVHQGALGEAIREASSHRGFWLLTAGFFVCGFQVTFVAVHLPAFIADKGLPAWLGAASLSLIGLFNIAGTLLAGWLGGRYRKKYVLALLYLLRSLAFVLFLMNALAGRIWCGYLCPQTVWTDLYFLVERVFQGERREQMKRDNRWRGRNCADEDGCYVHYMPTHGPNIFDPIMHGNDPNGACGVASDALGVVGWWVNPQAPGIDACGQAIKLMELTLNTNS